MTAYLAWWFGGSLAGMVAGLLVLRYRGLLTVGRRHRGFRFARLDLKTDPTERLEKRIVEICRKAISLTQGCLKLDRSVAASVHFRRELLRFTAHLPAQLRGPQERRAEGKHDDRDRAKEAPGRPPRG